jgi:transcriptional regulator with XRE-family HTH domain
MKNINRVQAALKISKTTQEELARRLGVSQPCISYYITKKRKLKVDFANKICKALNLKSHFFFLDDEDFEKKYKMEY